MPDGGWGRQYAESMARPNKVKVRDIYPGLLDDSGRQISEVLAKREKFALYLVEQTPSQRTRRRPQADATKVYIQLADDQEDADDQALSLNGLLCQRARLQYLSAGLPCQRYYTEQIAVALRCALEGNRSTASDVLSEEIKNATQDRARRGRSFYLKSAATLAFLSALILMGIGAPLHAKPLGALLLSAGGGAIGALFSIAIAIKSRTVSPDRDGTTNLIDGGLRVVIGVIAGFALHLLLSTGLLDAIATLGDAHRVGIGQKPEPATIEAIGWQVSIALGLVAGFLERMVPDLLNKNG